jgi:hypothetical protein
MEEPLTAANILVSGDFVLDHHIYEGNRHHFGDLRHRGVQEVEELGGAALIHYLLTELAGGVVSHLSVAVDDKRVPSLPPGNQAPAELSAYAIWRPFGPDGETSPEKRVWLTEDAMGFGRLPEKPGAFHWPRPHNRPKSPEVVVLSDGGMGFRGEPRLWPSDTILKQAKWIVLKTAEPFAAGKLWTHVARPAYRSKLVVVVSSSDLRKSSAQISNGFSWDATVESVLAALTPGGALSGLTSCRHLLVAFGTEGGLWLDLGSKTGGAQAHLVYDADAVEGEHRKPGKGKAFGALSCLTAAAAWHLARATKSSPDLETGLEGGLSAIHDLLEKGHGPSGGEGKGFPAKRLAKVIKDATCRYARTVFPVVRGTAKSICPIGRANVPASDCWSLVHEALRQQGQRCPDPAWALATLAAQRGHIAIGSLPYLSIGKLVSADRREIEILRVLKRLMIDYRERPSKDCKKPLAIGVFGPPGSGKSFAVKQIAETLLGKEGWMEFNLSQFKKGTEDLIGAFHQIRDRVLRGQTPVAFFDEFDSREYEWLQYLLAPMQDGAFQEGQITHPIGKCIFIFAGGTSWTFDSFGPPKKNTEAYAKFQMAKGPDFKSRLDGFLDLLGPNRRQIVSVKTNGREYTHTPDPCDIFYPIRRAFIIRSELGCGETDKLSVDAGVLRALLRVNDYVHGSRSLSKVLEPMKTAFPGAIYRSLLPPRQQLALHVKVDEFMRECSQAASVSRAPGLDPAVRKAVAVAIHETWRQLGKGQGWLEAENDVDFSALSTFYKGSNLAAADRMAKTLDLIGLIVRSGMNTGAAHEAVRLKIEYNLELLAEAEHMGWMEWHLDQGWEYAPQKVKRELTQEPKVRTHPCLRPYLLLSDVDRNKDRDAIRHYQEFAIAAGMKIVARA